MECSKAQSGVRKAKKKQVKDELDRIKQAEKKKRRLEKALATSAAIISELEKKKQKKKEEQQRLDEEGAAIAEAVALQVLIGEEEEDDKTCRFGSNFDVFGARTTCCDVISHEIRHQEDYGVPNEGFEWVFNGRNGSIFTGVEAPYVDERGWGISAAVSSLQIADDEDMNAFVFNRMVRG